MATPMKGLTQFIADLRTIRSHEAEQSRVNEELANIRQKFRDPGLNNYNRRKYVAKLIYIYMLGYPVDIGHVEALALIDTPKFPEKQVGYLALGIILNEDEKVIDQTFHTVHSDLASMSDLETALALNYLSTLSKVDTKLVSEVYKLLISPTSAPSVKKKAALVLKNMYIHEPTAISPDWVDRIIALLDNPDVGVATSVSALIKAMATDDHELCSQAYPAAIRRLEAILYGKDYPPDQVYYDVPLPWFTVKLLEIIELFPADPQNQVVNDMLRKVLTRVVDWATNDITVNKESPQHQNARNSIFFEVIDVLSHVNASADLMDKVVLSLADFLDSEDSSFRYLALNSMKTLSHVPSVQNMLDQVLKLLKDRDVSVRRNALDVLYQLTNSSNVEHIAAELLDNLPMSDISIREEMVTVLAAIIEKYATSHRWYVDTTLSLLMIGGSHVSDQVRHRLLQIIVNNAGIQVHAAKTVFEYLQKSDSSEHMLKVGAYILGEYGHTIAHEPGHTPMDQFVALQDRSVGVSDSSKQILLSTFIKFAARYRDMVPRVEEALMQYIRSSDLELQQRAIEYLNMLQPQNIDLLPSVWSEMPPYTAPVQDLVPHLGKSKPALMRQNTGITRRASRLRRVNTDASVSSNGSDSSPIVPNFTGATAGPLSSTPTGLPSNGTGHSIASRASVSAFTARPLQPNETGLPSLVPSLTGPAKSASPAPKEVILSSNWEHGFRYLLTHTEGTLYQDALLQVGCKYEFTRNVGFVILYLKNISSVPLTSLNTQITNPMGEDVLSITSKNLPASKLQPGEITEQVVICEAKQPFAVSPVFRITYIAGAFSEMAFRLPIVIERFMEPATLEMTEFLQRWNQIGPSGEFQKTFRNWSTSKVSPVVEHEHDVIEGLGYGIADLSRVTTEKFFGASILHTTSSGKYGCLIRVEGDPQRDNMKVVARATKKLVAVVMAKNLSNAYQL